MRWTLFGALVWFVIPDVASAGPPSVDDIPRYVNVSEVSKVGPAVHNRLTFHCDAPAGPNRSLQREIDCMVIQQTVQEPRPLPSQQDWEREWARQAGKLTEKDFAKACRNEGPSEKPWPDLDLRDLIDKVRKACARKDRPAIAARLGEFVRKLAELDSQTCQMLTVPRRETFAYEGNGVWVKVPPFPNACDNIKVVGTLRRAKGDHGFWTYSEVTVATPSKDASCNRESGTVEYTWQNAVTAHELGCRYLAM